MTGPVIVHYDKVEDPFYYRKCRGFDENDRFQVVAIDEESRRIVGYWRYMVWPYNHIRSGYTYVAGPYRKMNVALKMWRAGIERWGVRRVVATIASWDGLMFLANATVKLKAERGVDVKLECCADWMSGFQREALVIALKHIDITRRAAKKRASNVESPTDGQTTH